MRYVYHYRATCHDTDDEIDGLLNWSRPITAMDQYRAAKRMIAELAQKEDGTPRSSDYMTIKSLTLLHELDD